MHKPNLRAYRFKEVPLTPFHWKVVYDGDGQVLYNPDGSGDLVFAPQVAQTSANTHAVLLLLKDTLAQPVKDYAVKIELTTKQQLRSSTPNDWEVFWFFGNYRKDPGQSKVANYVILKPNTGIELGRVFDEVGQHFLKTDSVHGTQIGERVTLAIVKKGRHLQVFKNGNLVMSYESGQLPEALYDLPGALGLYSEDALVRVHSFAYQAL
ncbi:hypothetical protein D3C87_176710 [compost metagenome]